MFKYKHNAVSLLIAMSLFSALISCHSTHNDKFSTSEEIENKDSKLLGLLLSANDFDNSTYKLDFVKLTERQFYKKTTDKAYLWVTAYHEPENEYLWIVHGLFQVSNKNITIDDFYVFRYDTEIYFEPLKQPGSGYDVKCSKEAGNNYQECIFAKQYNEIFSTLSIEVNSRVDPNTIVDWADPFLEKIEKKMIK